MLIGQLCTLTGVSTRLLRHYEKLKIIRSQRLPNGYRHYPEETVESIKAVRFLVCGGLSLGTIARILPSLMNQECRLEDPRIRALVEQESVKVKAKMSQLRRSDKILTNALKKGYIRRPPDAVG